MASKKVQLTLNETMQEQLDELTKSSGLKPSAVMAVALKLLYRNVEDGRLTNGLVRDLFSLNKERSSSDGVD